MARMQRTPYGPYGPYGSIETAGAVGPDSSSVIDVDDETSVPGQDTQANRVPQPYAAFANARAAGFIVALAHDGEIQQAWSRARGAESIPLGHLLVIASVNNFGRERLLWAARSAMIPDTPQYKLVGRAIERVVQSELRDVTCGTVILLERRGRLVVVSHIHQRYHAGASSASRALLLTIVSWCVVSLMSMALMLTQAGASGASRKMSRKMSRDHHARRRRRRQYHTPLPLPRRHQTIA